VDKPASSKQRTIELYFRLNPKHGRQGASIYGL